MQGRGPDPKGGHHCYKWGHEPDRTAIVWASIWGCVLAELGLPPETAGDTRGNGMPSSFLVGVFWILII